MAHSFTRNGTRRVSIQDWGFPRLSCKCSCVHKRLRQTRHALGRLWMARMLRDPPLTQCLSTLEQQHLAITGLPPQCPWSEPRSFSRPQPVNGLCQVEIHVVIVHPTRSFAVPTRYVSCKPMDNAGTVPGGARFMCKTARNTCPTSGRRATSTATRPSWSAVTTTRSSAPRPALPALRGRTRQRRAPPRAFPVQLGHTCPAQGRAPPPRAWAAPQGHS